MWKDKTTFFLRIGIQKFISSEQTDRNGEIYWRYYNCEVKESEPTNLDTIAKFNQRQEQTKNYDKANSEPAVN